jgi:hypothetical protein
MADLGDRQTKDHAIAGPVGRHGIRGDVASNLRRKGEIGVVDKMMVMVMVII